MDNIEQRPVDAFWTDRRPRMAAGVCSWCAQPITGFRDELSRREYSITGMCQDCQDKHDAAALALENEEGDDE